MKSFQKAEKEETSPQLTLQNYYNSFTKNQNKNFTHENRSKNLEQNISKFGSA